MVGAHRIDSRTERPALADLLVDYARSLAILTGAHLVSTQIRLRLPWGKPLGADYDAQPAVLYLALAVALAAAYGLAWVARHAAPTRRLIGPESAFRVLILGLALSIPIIVAILPEQSQLQLVYFVATSVALGVACIAWTGRLRHGRRGALRADLRRLWRMRYLPALWLRYSVQARYTQMALGILWIILLPLATSFVLALAFSQFLRIQIDVPFISFFLAGLVPWGMFSQSIQNGMAALLGRLPLMTQVAFPRETPVLVTLGEALVDLGFTSAAMLVVNALNGIWPNAHFVYLPLLLFILVCFTLGLMFFFSFLSALVRDIPPLVIVGLQLLFYLTPIIYPVESIPDRFRVLVLLNPITLVIQGFRDVIVYGRAPVLMDLYYPLVMAIALLYLGYTFFKANEERLADLT